MSVKVYYEKARRKVRCQCNDTWRVIKRNGVYQKCFPDSAGSMFLSPCPVCDYYYWYETRKKP